MKHSKIALICFIFLSLFFAGCIESTDNRVDQPPATPSKSPGLATSQPGYNADPIVGTWQWNNRNGVGTIVYVFSADSTFVRHEYPNKADYRGTWLQTETNKYTLTYQEPTPTELNDYMTYRPEMGRLYRDYTGEFLEKTTV